MKHKLVSLPLMGCICTFGFISGATQWYPLIRQVKCRSSNEFCSTSNRSAAQLRRKLWRIREAIGVRVENERAETSSLPRSPLPRLQPKPTYQRSFYHAENFPSRSNRSSPKAIIICSACIMVIVQISHQRNRISMLSVWGGEWVRWCAVDGEQKRRFGRKEKEGERKTCGKGKRWEIRWGATGKRENTLTLEWETLEEENERGRRTEEEEVAVVMGVAPPVFGTLRKLYATIFCPLFSQSALEKMIALIIFLKDRFSCQCITSRH